MFGMRRSVCIHGTVGVLADFADQVELLSV
jgi:hypothetical protein